MLKNYNFILSRQNPLQLCRKYYEQFLHSATHTKSAGIIVIGDEILKGDVQDTNSHYAMKMFHRLGITVRKVSVIGDDIDVISNEVKQYSALYDYVLTTGGIGPTHDDVTFAAIANAFNVALVPNPTLVKICSRFYKTEDIKAPGMKLVFVPETSKLTFGDDNKTGRKVNYPNVSIGNVYIFPGIPQLFTKSLDALGTELFQSQIKFYGRNVYLNVNEQMVVNALDSLVVKYPEVMFGSYPDMNNVNYKVKLTIESTDFELTRIASEELINSFAKADIVETSSTTGSNKTKDSR